MTEYKALLGSIATVIALVSYIPYFRNIFRNKTKPHAFSWFIWGLLTAIAFAAQVVERAGAGAWVTGVTALACFTISALALVKGVRVFPVSDWIALCVALFSLGLWWWTSTPTFSVVLITLTDAIGFLPTFRKGFAKPHEETAITYALSSLKFVIALFALSTFTLATWLYPASLVLMNGLFVVVLLVRRRQLMTVPA